MADSLTILARFILFSFIFRNSQGYCGVGVTWFNGKIVYENVIDGSSITLIEEKDVKFNSLTHVCQDASFYTVAYDTMLYKYNPCSNMDELISIGTIGDVRGLAYNPKDDLLYGVYATFDIKAQYDINALYKINRSTAEQTYIGSIGNEDRLQSAECDANGILYSWSNTNGLITIDTTNASVTIINSNTTNNDPPSIQYLTFDPYDTDIIYGSDISRDIIYRINKLDGTFTETDYVDNNSLRGFIILRNDACNEKLICDCNGASYIPIEFPTTTTAKLSGSASTNTNKPVQQHMQDDTDWTTMIIVIAVVAMIPVLILCHLYRVKMKKKEKKKVKDVIVNQYRDTQGQELNNLQWKEAKPSAPINDADADDHDNKSDISKKPGVSYEAVSPSAPPTYEEVIDVENNKLNTNRIGNEGEKDDYNEVTEWLDNNVDINETDKQNYCNILIENGFENVNTIKTITENQLRQIGITKFGHINIIMSAVENL